ncbi:hypothetical protein SXCC_01241 [Gluconacetobacter sp. SXCC-1]|nr:hypothetical protein SXCC_01241 [Gluconacetobacter sp. SXCC-1]
MGQRDGAIRGNGLTPEQLSAKRMRSCAGFRRRQSSYSI